MCVRKNGFVIVFFSFVCAIFFLIVFLNSLVVSAEPGNPIIYPAANSHTDPATAVSITYDEAIDANTVSSRTFAVHAMNTGLQSQILHVDLGTITLTPTQPFKPGELVQVSATTGTLNLSGEGPISPTVWQFWAPVADGSGVFTAHGTTPSFGGDNSMDVDLGDVDADGDLDAIVANLLGQPQTVWLNDGMGVFTAHPTTPSFGGGSSHDVDLGDIDHDGDLDAVVSNWSDEPQTVWLNDGNGVFTAHPTAPGFGAGYSNHLALGDIDGDSDLDVVVANKEDQLQTVWLNDGTGVFTAHPTAPTFGDLMNYDGWSHDIDLGDVDGDADLDAVVGNYGKETVWLNDGRGVFTAHPTSPVFNGYNYDAALALGDVDNDGDLDVLAAGGDSSATTVWLNNGAGVFTAHPTIPGFGAGESSDVTLGDLDGDGDLDALVVNYNEEAQTVWLNDGTGAFTAHPTMPGFGAGNSRGMALGDVDGNGTLDVLVGNSGMETVWLNQKHPGLRIFLSTNNESAGPGHPISYTISYLNLDSEIASSVYITDIIPSLLNEVYYFNSGATITPTGDLPYSWQVADLASGAGGTITLTGIVSHQLSSDISLVNSAYITSTISDTNPFDNSAQTEIVVTVPRVRFDSFNYYVNEDSGQIRVWVYLIDLNPYAPVTVSYATADGTATSNIDYLSASGDLTIPAGHTSVYFDITILDDAMIENEETIMLSLDAPIGAALTEPNIATIRILDDDSFSIYLPLLLQND